MANSMAADNASKADGVFVAKQKKKRDMQIYYRRSIKNERKYATKQIRSNEVILCIFVYIPAIIESANFSITHVLYLSTTVSRDVIIANCITARTTKMARLAVLIIAKIPLIYTPPGTKKITRSILISRPSMPNDSHFFEKKKRDTTNISKNPSGPNSSTTSINLPDT